MLCSLIILWLDKSTHYDAWRCRTMLLNSKLNVWHFSFERHHRWTMQVLFKNTRQCLVFVMSWNYFHLAWCLSNVADSRCDLRAPLVPRLINHPFRWEGERMRKRERESFGKCYGKGGGDGHAALFRKLFLIVAVWRRQVSQWQRSKNKTLSIRLWNFSKCLHPLLVDLREEGLLEVEKIFLFHWLEQCPYFFSANYFGAFKPDMFSGLSVDTKKKKKKDINMKACHVQQADDINT